MRGTTEKVPSFWMLACTRSLMNRASRSSTYSSCQRLFSSDASPFLLFSSSPLPNSPSTADTLLRPRRRTSATSVGLSSGTAATYHDSDGSAFTSPATASISPLTSVLQLPQPVPARVALPTAGTVHLPALIAAQMVPLLTPLQSQIWCESGRSASDTSFFADAAVKNTSSRRSGTGASDLNNSIRLSA